MLARSGSRCTTSFLLAAGTVLAALGGPGHAHASFMFVTNFAKNGNMQANLQSSFPSGMFTPSNSFQTPFNITSDGSGNNFAQLFGSGGIFVDSDAEHIHQTEIVFSAWILFFCELIEEGYAEVRVGRDSDAAQINNGEIQLAHARAGS